MAAAPTGRRARLPPALVVLKGTLLTLLGTLLAVALIAASSPVNAQSSLPNADRRPAQMLGVAWYPEQWPESRWEADLALMQQAHVRFVRIGEFAWSALEPKEGVCALDWMERAIRAAERHGMAVVLGTPSAAPLPG